MYGMDFTVAHTMCPSTRSRANTIPFFCPAITTSCVDPGCTLSSKMVCSNGASPKSASGPGIGGQFGLGYLTNTQYTFQVS